MIACKVKHIAITILVSLFIAGCGYTKLAESTSSRPSYSPYYPSNLDIVYSTNDVEFNSFEGYIIKDIGTGSAKIPFILSENDRIRIYAALKDMDISSYPDQVGGGSGYSRKSLRIRYENIVKDISWDIYQTNGDDKLGKLKDLERVLDTVLYNNPFYKSLPDYEGPLQY
jgi:hypothetical protein